MSEDQNKTGRDEGLKKLDKALDKGFRLIEWAVFAFLVFAIGYFAYLILGVMDKPLFVQWVGAGLIGLVGAWLTMKILKVLSWFGFG